VYDINKAIALSKNSSEKIGYSFTRDLFSNNWSRLPSYLKVPEKWESGWEAFLSIKDPEFVAHRSLKDLEADHMTICQNTLLQLASRI